MSTAFTVLASTLPRLLNLKYATDLATRGPLAHIHVSITGDDARFVATDGRLLALVKLSVGDCDGEPVDVVLDGALFAATCATLIRSDHASMVRIVIDTEEREARFIRGNAVAVVRVLDLAYPVTSRFLERYHGQTMVPAIASFAPSLMTAAARIIGARRTTLLLWSPTTDSDLVRCWSRAPDNDAPVSHDSIAALLAQPGVWSDRELFVLLMPMTRTCDGAPDVSPFMTTMPAMETAEVVPTTSAA